MLLSNGSFEIAEWIAELSILRPEDEAEAMKRAEQESKRGHV